MIIWLASYPKSGNTWVRIIISSIIYYKKINLENPFSLINQIDGYPNMNQFSDLVKDAYNPDEIIPNWIKSQKLLNLNKNIKILKTHNMLGSFGKHKFTDNNNTRGVIHIVRDPRNVVLSIKNHFSLPNIDKATKFLLDKNKWVVGSKDKGVIPNFISSWQMHYISWKSFPKNNLLIKYEDLLENPINEINKIYIFLKKFFDLNLKSIDLERINNLSSFDNLKKKESEGKFKENLEHLETKKKIKFFNLGPLNNWKADLDQDLRYKIEREFNKEMKELGYL